MYTWLDTLNGNIVILKNRSIFFPHRFHFWEFLAETLHGTTFRVGEGWHGARFLNFASKNFLRGVKVLGLCWPWKVQKKTFLFWIILSWKLYRTFFGVCNEGIPKLVAVLYTVFVLEGFKVWKNDIFRGPKKSKNFGSSIWLKIGLPAVPINTGSPTKN